MIPASTLITLALLVPLVGALLVGMAGRWPNLREAMTLLAGGGLFASISVLTSQVLAGGCPELTVLEPLPGLALYFKAEPLGVLFALIASGLWIVTSVYAIGYMRAHHEAHQTRFYIAFAISIASAMGVALAGNLFTLFVFYELLTLATYPLVTHTGTEAARRAGRTYLGVLLSTSIGLQLLALVGTWVLAGSLDFRNGGLLAGSAAPDSILAGLLTLYVLGIGKAAVMPVHRWLPAAMVAPTPVSALLHAVAVVKAGVFAVLKVVVYIFGLDTVTRLATTEPLLYLATATILIASLIALRQDDLKRRLAYSTVSQLSYIVAGALVAAPLGVIGGAMHIATHAFGKITLFFCAGAILVTAHKTRVSELNGLGRHMPMTFAAFFVASLSIIGLPPGGGLWSKWYLALGALEGDQEFLVAVLMISSLLNIAYLLPIPLRAFFAESPAALSGGVREAPVTCLTAIALTASGAVALFFLPGLPYTAAAHLFEG